MPFIYYRRGERRIITGPIRDIANIHRIVIERAIPSIDWRPLRGGGSRHVPILPNWAAAFRTQDTGPTKSHDSSKYFALACEIEGLSLPETGLWLDTYIERGFIDEKRKQLCEGDMASFLRLDRRKPIYWFDGTCHYLISINTIVNDFNNSPIRR